MRTQSLSVSIVIYELEREVLSRCLRSLSQACRHAAASGLLGNWKLTLIDNGDNQTALQQVYPAASSIVENHCNLGFGRAHNQAIVQADTDIHLVLNPDVIFEEDAILEALKCFARHADAVACGPLGEDSAHRNLYLSKRYPAVFDLLLRGFMPPVVTRLFRDRLDRYEYRELDHCVIDAEVTLLSGCCLFVRTELLKKVEGFDPGYFLYFEDYDLCLRLSKLGQLIYVPRMRVTHFGGNSSKKGILHIGHFCRSAFRFYQKNGWKVF